MYKISSHINIIQGCKWHYKKFSESAGVQGAQFLLIADLELAAPDSR